MKYGFSSTDMKVTGFMRWFKYQVSLQDSLLN